MVNKTERLRELNYKARRYSIKEGIFSSAKISFGDNFISPFAIAVKSSNSLVAMLSSISGLLGPLTQLFSSRLLEKHSRKKIILKSVLFESLIWLPLITIALLFYLEFITEVLPFFLLLVFGFYIIFVNIGKPAWFSWMGDIVGEKYRGKWFSKRSLITGFVSISLAIFASFFLDFFKEKNWTMFGFICLFSLALICRLISRKIFKKKYEPKIKIKKGYYFSFSEFITKAPKNNFGRFSIFRAAFAFTCSISSSLLAVYLLRNLNFSYIYYMIITLSGAAFSLLVLELWGKFADKYGNYMVLGITSIILPIIPILWILSPSPIYLILVPSIIGGVSWAGFHLSAGNFIYDNVSKTKRGLAVSYHNMLNGIGIFLGAGLGALLIKFLPGNLIEPIFLIFIIGSIGRMIIIFWWIPKIKEIRKKEKFNGSKAFKHMIFREVKPTILEEVHQIMSIKKYLRK